MQDMHKRTFAMNDRWGGQVGRFGMVGNFARPCGRTRRASVPARLRARGLGVACTPVTLDQHLGSRASSATAMNGSRPIKRCGTAIRHVSGLGWRGDEDQAQQVHSIRVVSTKWLGRRMDGASSASSNGVSV